MKLTREIAESVGDFKHGAAPLDRNEVLSLIAAMAVQAGYDTPAFKKAMKLFGEVLFTPELPITPGRHQYSPEHLARLRQEYPLGSEGSKMFEASIAINSRLHDIAELIKSNRDFTVPGIAVPGSTALN